MNEDKSVLEFPCHFPIKIMGNNSQQFIVEIIEIIQRHFPEIKHEDINQLPSKNANYLGLTIKVYALSQSMLDDFYREVSAHSEVKMVL